jgi:molecular chaperone GrpE (heat shock protein)
MSVAGETARGYLLHGRVLRPAMVTVAVAPDDSGPSAADA